MHDESITKEQLIQELTQLRQRITELEKAETQRKQTAAALQESEERFKAQYQGNPIPTFTWRKKGEDFELVDYNDAAKVITNGRVSQFVGKTATELYRDREYIIQDLQQCFAEKKVIQRELQSQHFIPGRLLVTTYAFVPPDLVMVQIEDITERKLAEEVLRNREGMLQRIFDILPVGLWFVDKNGKLLRGNPAGVKIWGAEPKVSLSEYGVFKARRLPSGEEVVPDDWALAHTIRDKVTIVDELLEIDAFDGKKKTILNYTAPVLDAQGDVQGAIVVNQDITERKRAEETLRESEAKLRTIFEILPVGVSIIDSERKVSYANSALGRILDISMECLFRGDYNRRKILRPDGTLMPAEEYASIRALKEQRAVHHVETGVVTEAGKVIWVSVSAVPVAFLDWKVIIVTFDITERKRAEEALQEANQRLEAHIVNSPLAIVEFDPAYRVIRWSGEAERIFGWRAEEILGKAIAEIP